MIISIRKHEFMTNPRFRMESTNGIFFTAKLNLRLGLSIVITMDFNIIRVKSIIIAQVMITAINNNCQFPLEYRIGKSGHQNPVTSGSRLMAFKKKRKMWWKFSLYMTSWFRYLRLVMRRIEVLRLITSQLFDNFFFENSLFHLRNLSL